jgi:cell division protein FtsB
VGKLPHLPLMPLIAGLSLIAIAYLGVTTVRYFSHNYQLRNDERALQREIDALDADRAQLAATRDYLKSDEYIEYIARRVLGLVRPGETLVVVSGIRPQPTPTPAGAADLDWWKQLFAAPPAEATPAPPFPRP